MMSSARPTAWHEGLASSQPVVLCGEHTHYAVSRAVGVMALGVRQIVTVASDGHRMDARALPPALARVRNAAVLDTAFLQHAPYLFHQLDDGPSNDLGPRSFLCSRRGDALKVWAAILRYGRAGIAGFYEYLSELTVAFHRMVDAHPSFEALHTPETNILCFRFSGADTAGPAAADEVNRDLRERYNASGKGWITSTILGGRRVLRVTIINPLTTERHLAALLDGLATTATEPAGASGTSG